MPRCGDPGGRKIMSLRQLTALTLLGAAYIAPVHAQSDEDVDNIIVTGSRSPIASVSLGSSATVITRAQIESRQSRYVSDLLRAVPGFSVSQTGTTGTQTQVRVRGAEANHVLVLIDGIRANDPASGDEFRWEYLSTSNIERIEIVRGPQSSLWGSDAVAAVVHVITQDGSAGTGIGGYAEGGSDSTVNAGLNGSFSGEKWSIGYGVDSLATDGTNISRSGDEADESDMTTATVTAKVNATENLSFNFGGRAVDAYSQVDPVDFVTTGLPVDGDLANEASQLYLHAGGVLRSPNSTVGHSVYARYLDTTNDSLTDGIRDASTASDRRTLGYQADIRLSDDVLSLALEHEITRFEQRGEIVFGDPNQNQESDVTAVIADYQGNFSANLTWLASARFDNYSDFEDAVTGRLSVAYDLTETTRLRGTIGSGQKAPTFTERFGFFPGQFVGNPDLNPEKSTSVDIGIDQTFPDSGFTLQLSYFHQNLTDEINGFAFDPDTSLFTAENLAGDSIRRGVEFAATWRPGERLLLAASYTYTDSKEEDDQGVETREIRRPRHAGNLSGEYRFWNERGNLALVADYGGSRTDVFFPPFPEPSAVVTLDAAWLVDLTIGLDITPTVNLFARATNLLDDDYEQVYGYQTRGRAGFVGLRLTFGE